MSPLCLILFFLLQDTLNFIVWSLLHLKYGKNRMQIYFKFPNFLFCSVSGCDISTRRDKSVHNFDYFWYMVIIPANTEFLSFRMNPVSTVFSQPSFFSQNQNLKSLSVVCSSLYYLFEPTPLPNCFVLSATSLAHNFICIFYFILPLSFFSAALVLCLFCKVH